MADISNKERFRQRYAKRNPDLNMDDEEAYYGSVNQFMDEYEGYEGNSKKCGRTYRRVQLSPS